MERHLPDEAALLAEAEAFAHTLVPRAGGATLVTLSGELGAGKTTFVKGVARGFGLEEVVTSPTFVLEKIYALPGGSPFTRLVHVDAYRLSGHGELAPLGFDELMRAPENLVALEWPERVSGGLPEPAVSIKISTPETGGLPGQGRVIRYG